MADAYLRHHGDGHRGHDVPDDPDLGHSSNSAFLANVRWNPLQCHHGGGARVFCNDSLLGVDDVHDHAALKHLGQSDLQPKLFACKMHFTLPRIPTRRRSTYTSAIAGSESQASRLTANCRLAASPTIRKPYRILSGDKPPKLIRKLRPCPCVREN